MTRRREWLRTGTRALLGLALVHWTAACGDSGTEPVPQPTPVASVAVAPLEGPWTGTLLVNQSARLAARALDAAGGEIPAGPATWSSSDSTVAVVDASGRVTARGEGSAQIRAAIAGTIGTVELVVLAIEPARPVARVVVGPAGAIVNVGGSRSYTARAFDDQGAELVGRTVVWSTGTPTVIHVDPHGLVRAVGPGYGDVRATIEGVTGTVAVTVPTPETVRAVLVTPSSGAVLRNSHVQLTARALGAGGGDLPGRTATWTSENPEIATVGVDGLVLGIAKGRARIRATIDGVSGFTTVEVREFAEGRVQGYALRGTWDHRVPTIEVGQTTWTDAAGAVHEAYLLVRGGTMQFDHGKGTYVQTFVVETRLRNRPFETPAVRTEAVVDRGTMHYNFLNGTVVLRSTTTPGLEHRPLTQGPGEYLMPQSVLGTASRPWVWVVE